MKPQPSMIIIGAGMAGLSAGCYAQMNGFSSKIFEQNHRPGGLCQSWERHGYTINGCIHWLVGSDEKNSLHSIWRELGATQTLTFFNHDRFAQFEHPEGTVILYSEVDKLEAHLLDLAPEDERWIRQLTQGIRVLSKYGIPWMDDKKGLSALLQNVRMFVTRFPVIRQTMKWWRLTMREFAAKLKNPVLKAVFYDFWHPDMSMITFVMTMAFLHNRNAGYPLGGSSAFIERVVRRYQQLGGHIQYGTRVKEILVEEGVARGVRLQDGSLHEADHIVSAADGYQTLFEMLGRKYVNRRVENYYREMDLFPPLLFASFGIAASFEKLPSSVSGVGFPLRAPLLLGNRSVDRLTVQIYNFDPTLAPAGKTTLTTMIEADYDYWRALYEDRDAYDRTKIKILERLIHGLEERFPGIQDKIEMSDLSTPVTFQSYTGNYRGSYEGWLPTPRALRTQMEKTLPGLDHFYMVGHWVEPGGGLPPAALSGRQVVRAICRREGIEFQTAEPADARQKKEVI